MGSMSLVQVEQLEKSFGGDILFAPFSAQIGPGDRVALIGDNGVGKSIQGITRMYVAATKPGR